MYDGPGILPCDSRLGTEWRTNGAGDRFRTDDVMLWRESLFAPPIADLQTASPLALDEGPIYLQNDIC